MISLFDVKDISKSASTFSAEKLTWLNHQHITKSNEEELIALLLYQMKSLGINPDTGPDLSEIIAAYKERSETLLEMARSSSYCFEDFDEIDEKAAKKHLRPVILDPLTDAYNRFENIKDWTLKNIDTAINETVDKFKINMGKLGQPI